MNITIFDGLHTLPVKFTTFSDSSETCTIPETIYNKYILVSIAIKDCNRDLIRIGLVKQAIDDVATKGTKVSLDLKYMPQARADRVFGANMPLPIKLFANILNSYKFDTVFIEDPHSDVTSALVDNIAVTHQKHTLAGKLKVIKEFMPDFTICAPDLGATKKIFDVAQHLKHDKYIQAIKVRDVTTGNIVKCDVIKDFDFTGQDVLIVDDISDGGASFKFLAQKLKALGAKRVGLYVTHAIFANGLDCMEDVDYIFCSNIIGDYITQEDLEKFNCRNA